MTKKEVPFTVSVPQQTYLSLHELRLSRARRDGCVPPTLKTLVAAALDEFVRREQHA